MDALQLLTSSGVTLSGGTITLAAGITYGILYNHDMSSATALGVYYRQTPHQVTILNICSSCNLRLYNPQNEPYTELFIDTEEPTLADIKKTTTQMSTPTTSQSPQVLLTKPTIIVVTKSGVSIDKA